MVAPMHIKAHLLGVQKLARCDPFSQNIENILDADWLSESEHGEREFVNEPAEHMPYAAKPACKEGEKPHCAPGILHRSPL